MRTKEERKSLHSKKLNFSTSAASDSAPTTGGEQVIKEGGLWYKITHIGNKKMYSKLSDGKE